MLYIFHLIFFVKRMREIPAIFCIHVIIANDNVSNPRWNWHINSKAFSWSVYFSLIKFDRAISRLGIIISILSYARRVANQVDAPFALVDRAGKLHLPTMHGFPIARWSRSKKYKLRERPRYRMIYWNHLKRIIEIPEKLNKLCNELYNSLLLALPYQLWYFLKYVYLTHHGYL